MRRAFTLMEMLVVIALVGLLISVGVISIRAGKGAARVKGATRDIYAAIRHARSTALVTAQPAIITYSTVMVDGEVMAKAELTSVKLFDTARDLSDVQTLSGEPVKQPEDEVAAAPKRSKNGKGDPAPTTDGGESEGESLSEFLFAPVDADVVKGMRLKVVVGDEDLKVADTGRKSKISVFSNVDYLLGRFSDAKAEAKKKEAEKAAEAGEGADSPADEELQAEVSVAWEANGRVEPHRVWVYADGQKPEDGLLIQVDRFGAAKVYSGDGSRERD